MMTIRISGRVIVWGLVGALILGLLLFIRPGLQPSLLYFYNNLIPWLFGLAATAAFGKAMWIVMTSLGESSKKWWLLTAALLIVAIFFAFYCPAVRRSAIADRMEPKYITELPETERVRFTPFGVAQTLMGSKQLESHLRIGDIDPADIDGQFVWITPRIPNGGINAIYRGMDGFIIVEEDKALPPVTQPFKYGEGSWFYRSILWQLRIRHYGCSFPEIFYLSDLNGGYMGVAPYIGWRWHWITTVPRWAGVAIFHADGRVEDLTVEQALVDPRFEGQRLYPEVLALWQAKAWAYKDGIGNAWAGHDDQVEIPRLAHSNNQMPFLLPGNFWMVAAEPYGPSQSIFKLFFFDAHDGTLEIYEFGRGQMALGPNIAWGYAQSKTPGYTWRESSGDSASGTYVLVEARPVIKDGKLYWMYTVTTESADLQSTGIALTVLVGGEDEVLHFCSRASLERWLDGRGGSDPIPCGTLAECPACPASGRDLAEMSLEELFGLIRQALEELEQRP